MKKIISILLIISFILPIGVYADDITPGAKSSILMEISTKTILYEKNKDERLAIASLTKMMAQILIMEAIESGNLTWDEMVKTSSNAASFGGTQIYLAPGEVMSVRDLMKGVSMASANDATVVLAEKISGSEEKFVEAMNNKARELGLKNTNFVNSTGLDEDNHYSSSYDLALIAIELLKHEKILEFTSLYEDYLRQDTANKFWLVNTNKLVRSYPGVDGLKTGFTDSAKYTMAVTGKRGNMRLIAIVLGEEVSKVRNQEVSDLLDYGFNLYDIKLLKKKNDVIKEVTFDRGSVDKANIILDSDVTILSKKSDGEKEYKENINLYDIKLPINKGDKVGILEIYDNNKIIGEYPLIISSSVKRKNIFKIFLDNLYDIVSANLIF